MTVQHVWHKHFIGHIVIKLSPSIFDHRMTFQQYVIRTSVLHMELALITEFFYSLWTIWTGIYNVNKFLTKIAQLIWLKFFTYSNLIWGKHTRKLYTMKTVENSPEKFSADSWIINWILDSSKSLEAVPQAEHFGEIISSCNGLLFICRRAGPTNKVYFRCCKTSTKNNKRRIQRTTERVRVWTKKCSSIWME